MAAVRTGNSRPAVAGGVALPVERSDVLMVRRYPLWRWRWQAGGRRNNGTEGAAVDRVQDGPLSLGASPPAMRTPPIPDGAGPGSHAAGTRLLPLKRSRCPGIR